MKVALTFAIGLLVGVVLSPVVWRDAASPAATELASPPVRVEATAPSPEPALEPFATAPNEVGVLAGWLELVEAERLRSFAQKATGAGLDLVARGVIDRLEEDSLKALIISATDFSSSELEEIEDLPAFAMDLARIAMEGTLRDAGDPNSDVRAIDFSSEVTADNRASTAQSQFFADEERIYAVFESDELGLSETLAKWTRVSDGEILLFKRHPIRATDDSSFVYLDAPPEGWEPGEYRVDFYTADAALRWVASGSHRITI